MADICCDQSEASAVVAASCGGDHHIPSSSSKRRRMDNMNIIRFKFVPDHVVQLESSSVLVPAPEINGGKMKRQKLENMISTAAAAAAVPPPPIKTPFLLLKSCLDDSNEKTKIISSTMSSESSDPVAVEQESFDRCPKFGSTAVCGRRRDMEDAVAIHPSFWREDEISASRFHFFGVYDGHGCSHVAMTCKDRLHQLVKEELDREKESSSSSSSSVVELELEWKATMERSFNRMDREVLERTGIKITSCRCELQMPQCDAVGSTAVVSIVTPDKVIVANCGDSRAVLSRGGKAVPLSIDHKPDLPEELNRIEDAGGRVIYWDGPRVLGVLAMSRAIGDNYLKPYVSSVPEITVTERSEEDEFLIMASDGLWDVVANDTACGIVRMCLNGKAPSILPEKSLPAKDGGKMLIVGKEKTTDKGCSDAAMLLTKLALARRSADNVSVVVVDLRRPGEELKKAKKRKITSLLI